MRSMLKEELVIETEELKKALSEILKLKVSVEYSVDFMNKKFEARRLENKEMKEIITCPESDNKILDEKLATVSEDLKKCSF